jgi:cell wall assembly regulator SMI1
MPNYIELLTTAWDGSARRPRFAGGAADEELARAERVLGTELPANLKGLLTQSNGVSIVEDETHPSWVQHIVLRVERMVSRNLEMRSLRMKEQ